MKTMLKIAVGVTCVLWLSGCQLFGGPSDETLVQETMSSFQESLLAQDVDAVLALYSENYSDAQGTTKSAVRTFLTAMSGGDGAAGLELTIDEAVVVINDDGTGVVQSMEVLRLFKETGIKPRHTLRAVLFMNEEFGLRGGLKYAEEAKLKNEIHVAAIESDAGGHTPRGFSYDGNKENIEEFMSWKPLFEPYGLHEWSVGFSGADIGPLKNGTISLSGYRPDSQRYFEYHHAATDTFDKVNERELHLGAAAMTSLVVLMDKYFDVEPIKK